VSTTVSEETVARAVAGDADALSALLREHGPTVERGLRINPIWQAQLEPSDVMQVTYLEAFLRIGSFDPGRADAFPSWLRRIAENNLRDAVRGLERQKQPQPRNRVRPGGHDESLVGLYNLLVTESGTPSRQVGRRELVGLLDDAIAGLPERYAEVIRLYDLEGRPIDEVAERLGRSPGAVHMLRARAHERLRVQLGSASGLFDSRA